MTCAVTMADHTCICPTGATPGHRNRLAQTRDSGISKDVHPYMESLRNPHIEWQRPKMPAVRLANIRDELKWLLPHHPWHQPIDKLATASSVCPNSAPEPAGGKSAGRVRSTRRSRQGATRRNAGDRYPQREWHAGVRGASGMCCALPPTRISIRTAR